MKSKTITVHYLLMNCVPNAQTHVQIPVLVRHWPLPFAIDCQSNDCTIRRTHADWCASNSRSIVAADSTTNMDRMHRTPNVGSDDSRPRCRYHRQLNNYRRVHCHCHGRVYVHDHVWRQLPAFQPSTFHHTRSLHTRKNVRRGCDSGRLEKNKRFIRLNN